MAKRRVYLDNNATTPLHPEVKKAMVAAMEHYGNPSSLHEFGRHSRAMIEHSRETIASFIGAFPEEIIFVGSGSEANNTVFNLFNCGAMVCGSSPHFPCPEIITTRIEHPCVLETTQCMKERGTNVTFLDVDQLGRIDFAQLERKLREKPALVSVMTANNEIGTIQDIKRISKMCHDHSSLFHTDAVQAVGKMPFNVKELDIDYCSFSAHKIYGPKGVGALYIRKGAPFCPFIHGGHQEKGRRAGTENTLGIVGFGKAIELRKKEMAAEAQRLLGLRKFMRETIEKKIPSVAFNGDPDNSLPGTLNVSFEGAEGEAILLYLDLQGIAVSTGSACASGSLDPSHVLIATGISAERAHGSIRVSMGRETTREDIEYFLEKLIETIARVRQISSVTNEVHHG
ncbi:MAG: cysteine desulfurase family protein [Deltaproteobacteria bacterium]